MSALPAAETIPFTQFERLREGRDVIKQEAEALLDLMGRLDSHFCDAVDALCDCQGSVAVTGIGKAGLIGQKIAATLSSTGTRSHFLHPSEAVHGDLGCLHSEDTLLALSNSGETEEVCRLLPTMRQMEIPVIAMTGKRSSQLGSQAAITLELGRIREAGTHGLAPSTSTTAMLALGDALALVVSRAKGFTPRQFAVFHPGGSLGKKLTRVRDVMRVGGELRTAREHETVRDVFARASKPGRRTGAVIVIDAEDRLAGIFTDTDLVRLLEQRREADLDRPVGAVMTIQPLSVDVDSNLADAIEVLSQRKVSELPITDKHGRPVGVIDITDVVGLIPDAITD
jgi:arabinose-5-phosphate isomerase